MDHSYINTWPDSLYWRKPCYFVGELLKQGIENEVLEAVLKTIDRTCKHCWDAPSGCQCWNDE